VSTSRIPNVPRPSPPDRPHRPGRTAGVALSLCAPEERPFLKDIERLIAAPLGENRSVRSSATRPESVRRQPAAGSRAPRGKNRERRDERRSGGARSGSSAPQRQPVRPVRNSARASRARSSSSEPAFEPRSRPYLCSAREAVGVGSPGPMASPARSATPPRVIVSVVGLSSCEQGPRASQVMIPKQFQGKVDPTLGTKIFVAI
jgi:superfamily II DNA/RNA helicase